VHGKTTIAVDKQGDALMSKTPRLRFWIEAGIATVTGILFVITLAAPNWIERVFGIDPDGGNGSLEWLIVGVLLIATVALSIAARNEWRRTETAIG
jgi:hypothetical protein